MSFEPFGITKMALRAQVCEECPEHAPPARDDGPPLLPAAPAPCESGCALFVHLPRLVRVVRDGEPPCGYAMVGESLRRTEGGPDVALALAVVERVSTLRAPRHGREAECGGCERAARVTTQLMVLGGAAAAAAATTGREND